MLPLDPPQMSSNDFDPATYRIEDDFDMQDEIVEPTVELSSVEINILIYLYLLESNFSHTAFTLLSESNLAQTSLFQHYNPSYTAGKPNSTSYRANGATPGPSKGASPITPVFGTAEGKISRGELVRKLWKGLRWEEVERHIQSNGEPYKPSCPNPFHLLIPHHCPLSYPSARENPPLPLPPALRAGSPPVRRQEAFSPPPQEYAAGPSRVVRSRVDPDDSTKTRRLTRPGSGLRKDSRRRSHRISADNETPDGSPARSASPTKDGKRGKEKKKQQLSGGDAVSESDGSANARDDEAMDVDSQPRENSKGLSNGRGKSPGSARDTTAAGNKRRKVKLSNGPETDPQFAKLKLKRKLPPVEKDEVARSAIWARDEDVASWTEHRDYVGNLAWNPKNRDVLATASGDGSARLWEFHSTAITSKLELPKKPELMNHHSIDSSRKVVKCLSWHPDGTLLATGSQDGIGRLFDLSGHMSGIMTYGSGAVNAIRFSPDGSHILTAKNDYTVCLWPVGQSYQHKHTLSFEGHTKEVNDVDWLDNSVFASGGNDHIVFVWRAIHKRPHFALKGHEDDVTRIKWAPCGDAGGDRLLASVADDGVLVIWRPPSCPESRGISSRSLSKSPEEDTLFFEDESGLRAGDKYSRIPYLVHHIDVVDEGNADKRMSTLEWSPACKDGRMLVAAGGRDTTVKIYEALSGDLLHILSGLESGTGSIAFSPLSMGGHLGLIAAGGWNGQLYVWDVETGEKVKEYEIDEEPSKQRSRDQPMMLTMAWREDGQQLAVGLHNKSVVTLYVGDLGAAKVVEA